MRSTMASTEFELTREDIDITVARNASTGERMWVLSVLSAMIRDESRRGHVCGSAQTSAAQ